MKTLAAVVLILGLSAGAARAETVTCEAQVEGGGVLFRMAVSSRDGAAPTVASAGLLLDSSALTDRTPKVTIYYAVPDPARSRLGPVEEITVGAWVEIENATPKELWIALTVDKLTQIRPLSGVRPPVAAGATPAAKERFFVLETFGDFLPEALAKDTRIGARAGNSQHGEEFGRLDLTAPDPARVQTLADEAFAEASARLAAGGAGCVRRQTVPKRR